MHLARFLHDMRSPEGSRGIKEIDLRSISLIQWKPCEMHILRAPWNLMNEKRAHHIHGEPYGGLWIRTIECIISDNSSMEPYGGKAVSAHPYSMRSSLGPYAHTPAPRPPLSRQSPTPAANLSLQRQTSTPAANSPKLSILISTYKYLARNLPKF